MLWRIALRFHSLNFKAQDKLWATGFKRYFPVNFVENSAIFSAAELVQEELILIHLQLFPFRVLCSLCYTHHLLESFSVCVRGVSQLLVGAEFFSLLWSVKLFQKIKKFTVFLYLYLKLCLMKIINKYKL